MLFSDLIDQVAGKVDRSGPVDSSNAVRRSLLRDFGVEIFGQTWRDNGNPWSFKQARGSVTIPINDRKVLLPADFSEFGNWGGVYPRPLGTRIEPEDFQVIRDKQFKQGYVETTPTSYAVFEMDTGTKREYLQTAFLSAACTLDIAYSLPPPTLDEGANDANLKLIPEEFHQTVLVPGVKARAYESRGDATWKIYEAMYQRGLNQMRATKRPRKEGNSQLKNFFG